MASWARPLGRRLADGDHDVTDQGPWLLTVRHGDGVLDRRHILTNREPLGAAGLWRSPCASAGITGPPPVLFIEVGHLDPTMRGSTMTTFTGYQNFIGSYSGSYDGRNARLVISDLKDDSPVARLHLEFTDVDRGETYVGLVTVGTPGDHMLSGIKLSQKQGSKTVSWSRLLIHTWNVRFLCGESVWNGREFGMSFTRQ